jgi:hypothetical protein
MINVSEYAQLSARHFLLLIIFGCVLIACKKHPTGASWMEEVQLSNGTVITIRRTITGKPNIQAGYADFKPQNDRIEVIDSKGLSKPPVWESKWFPMILDQDTHGDWFIIVYPIYCFDWNSSFPYRQYKVINDTWQLTNFDVSLNGKNANIEWQIDLSTMPIFLKLYDKTSKDRSEDLTPIENLKVMTDQTYRSGC